MDASSCALLPSDCALCGSPLPLLSPVPICETCWTEFPIQKGPVCPRCGDLLDIQDPAVNRCRACRLAPPPFVRAVSYGPYEGRMREAIHALKYDRLLGAARRMGAMLAVAIAQLAADAPAGVLVIPVPLHRSKYSQRGFNQARMLASHAIRVLRTTHPGWQLRLAAKAVIRQRPTESQAGLTTRQRRLNVRGAFLVSAPGAVTARNVLVIDDIFTTGATARSVSRALLGAGAANVWVATLARARRAFDYRGNPDEVYSGRGLARSEVKRQLGEEDSAAELETATLHETESQPSF